MLSASSRYGFCEICKVLSLGSHFYKSLQPQKHFQHTTAVAHNIIVPHAHFHYYLGRTVQLQK